MLSSILASVASYAITNVDDLFVLMLLLGQGRGRGRIAAGHCLGVAALTLLSLLGALGLGSLPIRFTCLLGLIPMALGVRCILARTGKDADAALPAATLSPLGMAAVTLGNGADNLGVYIPLFTGFDLAEKLAAVAVFAVMTGLWLFLAGRFSALPVVEGVLRRYRSVLIPAVLILLGIFILLGGLQG